MSDTLTYPDIVTLAVPVFILTILAEIAAIRWLRATGRYETRDALTSLLMGAGNVVAGIALGFIAYGFYLWLWEYRVFDLGTAWYVVLLCFVLDDFRYYWYHRIAHTSRWVWAEHVNHHSSQHYNLTTALRQSWTGTFTFMWLLRAPLILLGFHPAMVIFAGGINLVYQFWIHTEAIGKLPRWFEAVFNTPSHHRVHHGRNPRYLDANYAGTLIIWDRMFGTFVPELEEEAVQYGLVHNIGTFNPLRVAFHEWVAMLRDICQPGLTWRQRLNYAIAPPGWSHDESRETSEMIKAAYVRRNPDQKGTPGL
ncbi:sterol desaturase family protein [Algicella marina]|uniref:Sterol desaturase family protein n=1 Tax=Algicella marina TaxID=2683284 RepID=A0A6P1T4P8_9RHOB|nr:sterol desaturase family protein [Algicella marina]QHQ36977.1 sterol desaturase family protein [Algicella marina]